MPITLPAGTTITLPEGLVHDVVATGSGVALSVHAYSPPLSTMGFYDAEGRYRVAIDDIDTNESGLPAIDVLLESARSRIGPRVNASDLDGELAAGALVIDTRSAYQRARDGDLPGAIVIERNVLEWRLDPSSPHRLAEADDPARRVVVVCDEGYASSLAAATLRDLGRTDVTDLDGGYQAWLRFASR